MTANDDCTEIDLAAHPELTVVSADFDPWERPKVAC